MAGFVTKLARVPPKNREIKLMKENLYVVSPNSNDWIGKSEFYPDIQFPWNNISVAPPISINFRMEITWKRLKKIDLDYFRSETPIVSERFASTCNEMGIDCQLIPLEIVLNGTAVSEKYFFILLNKFISIVDMKKTPHKRMMKIDGKEHEMNIFFPEIPEYEMLENIVINDDEKPLFFMSPEIGNKRVCTQTFKDRIENLGVKGIEFKAIDNKFTYQSFGF